MWRLIISITIVALSGTFTGEIGVFFKHILLFLGFIFLLSSLFTMSNALRSFMSFIMVFSLILSSWLNKGYLYGIGNNQFHSRDSDLSVLTECAQILTPIAWGNIILFISVSMIFISFRFGLRIIEPKIPVNQ